MLSIAPPIQGVVAITHLDARTGIVVLDHRVPLLALLLRYRRKTRRTPPLRKGGCARILAPGLGFRKMAFLGGGGGGEGVKRKFRMGAPFGFYRYYSFHQIERRGP